MFSVYMSKRRHLDTERTISYFKKSVATSQCRHLNQMPLVLFICCFFLCFYALKLRIQPLQHITQPFYRSSTYISLKHPALRVKSTFKLFAKPNYQNLQFSVYVILCKRKCIWCTYCLVVVGQIKHYEWGLFYFCMFFFTW